jgi:hypothetical protein
MERQVFGIVLKRSIGAGRKMSKDSFTGQPNIDIPDGKLHIPS